HFGSVRNPRLLTPAEKKKRERLRAREEELWNAHKGEWMAGLPTLSGICWDWPQRGFVEGVTAETFRAFRTHAAKLFDLVPLRGLRFGPCERFREPPDVKADSVVRLAEFAALARLRYLEFHGSRMGDRGAVALARSPHVANLVSLEISMSMVDDAG